MTKIKKLTLGPAVIILLAFSLFTFSSSQSTKLVNDCNCDTTQTKQVVLSKDFNRLPPFDDKQISDEAFYRLSADDNRTLWYRDVESPEMTSFTKLWNDYSPNNYHASHHDFIQFFQDKQDIELAFQFGPNDDLWAYHIFVIRKVGCCYLATRSYFRHARFTGKNYAIIDKQKLDSMFAIIAEQKVSPLDSAETFEYCGYFRDNRNKKSFYINFEKGQEWVADKQDSSLKHMEAKPEINKLYDFVDDKIKWIRTYR